MYPFSCVLGLQRLLHARQHPDSKSLPTSNLIFLVETLQQINRVKGHFSLHVMNFVTYNQAPLHTDMGYHCVCMSMGLISSLHTHMWIRIHKNICLSTDIYIGVCYFPTYGAKNYKSTSLQLHTLTLFFSPNLFLIGLQGRFFEQVMIPMLELHQIWYFSVIWYSILLW